MAVKKSTGKKKAAAKTEPQKQRGKTLIFWLLSACALAVAAATVWTAVKTPVVLMSGNPRFKLKHLEVSSSGYWHGKSEVLATKIGLKKGETNIFAIDPAELRKKILSEQRNIDSCEVHRILPDTLKLKLTERVARAVLDHKDSDKVVDERGNEFVKLESSASLPIIKRRHAKRDLTPALTLIMATVTDYPDISIKEIDLAGGSSMEVTFTYRNTGRRMAIIPPRQEYGMLLNALQSAIHYAPGKTLFDLRNSGQVVLVK